MHRIPYASLGVAFLIAFISSAAFAQVATRPKSATQYDARDAYLASNRRELIEDGYKKVGKRDPAWDAAAIAFLDRMAVRLADRSVTEWYRSDADTSDTTMLRLADRALKAGCSDPMVVHCRATVNDEVSERGCPDDVLASLPPVLAGPYSPLRKYLATKRLAMSRNFHDSRNGAAVRNQMKELWPKYLAEYLSSPVADPVEIRFRYKIFTDAFANAPLDRERFVVVLRKQNAVDPWLMHMLNGSNEIGLGWGARGGGAADTVTQDGWATLLEHMAKAREEFTAAYALHPTFPEAAQSMIVVAMGAGAQLHETPRKWFDLAIEAQFDHMESWSAFATTLRPRWYGSTQEMYQLGCEAMRTRRFDTAVPYYLIVLLEGIAQDEDAGPKYDFYLRPGVRTNIDAVFDGYLATAHPGVTSDTLLARKAVFAYRCAQYEVVTKLLVQLGDKVDAAIFTKYGLVLSAVRVECDAIASDKGDEVRAAMHAESAGDFGDAAKQWAALDARLPAKHQARPFVARHLYWSTVGDSLARGQLTPLPLRTPDDLVAWTVIAGTNWGPSDGVLTVKDYKGSIMYGQELPHDRETELEFLLTCADIPADEVVPTFGISLQDVSADRLVRCDVYPRRGQVQIESKSATYAPPGRTEPFKPDEWHKLSIRQVANKISVAVDGTWLIIDRPNGWLLRGRSVVGIECVEPSRPSDTVKVRNLTVKAIGGHDAKGG